MWLGCCSCPKLSAFQVPSSVSGGGDLEKLFHLCGRLERHGWDANRLLRETVQFLNARRKVEDIFDYFKERVDRSLQSVAEQE